MNEANFRQALVDLDTLSKAEYRSSVDEILSDSDENRAAVRLGRLVGVMLKQPFATVTELDAPSYRTSAYRAWDLVDESEFELKSGTWQYKVLDQIRSDLGLEDRSVFGLAQDAYYETGFFGYVARDLRKYICGDKAVRKNIADALKSAKLPPISPEAIVGAGGLSLGAVLVQSVPLLGMVGAPVVAAIVLILYKIGVDAFCKWSEDLKTEEDEKH